MNYLTSRILKNSGIEPLRTHSSTNLLNASTPLIAISPKFFPSFQFPMYFWDITCFLQWRSEISLLYHYWLPRLSLSIARVVNFSFSNIKTLTLYFYMKYLELLTILKATINIAWMLNIPFAFDFIFDPSKCLHLFYP